MYAIYPTYTAFIIFTGYCVVLFDLCRYAPVSICNLGIIVLRHVSGAVPGNLLIPNDKIDQGVVDQVCKKRDEAIK